MLEKPYGREPQLSKLPVESVLKLRAINLDASYESFLKDCSVINHSEQRNKKVTDLMERPSTVHPTDEPIYLNVIWTSEVPKSKPDNASDKENIEMPIPKIGKNGKLKLDPLKMNSSVVNPLTSGLLVQPPPIIKDIKWQQHRFFKCRASVYKFQMLSDPDQTILCNAVGRCQLVGDQFSIVCFSGKYASAILVKNFLGNVWKLYSGNRLLMVLEYDCSCAGEEDPRIRKVELCTYSYDNPPVQERFTSKMPIWSGESKGYNLDFQGRVGTGSVHNSILMDDGGRDALMFGVSRDQKDYILDVRPPLTQLHAFAMAISSVVFKLGTM